jgi:hypothetical protein
VIGCVHKAFSHEKYPSIFGTERDHPPSFAEKHLPKYTPLLVHCPTPTTLSLADISTLSKMHCEPLETSYLMFHAHFTAGFGTALSLMPSPTLAVNFMGVNCLVGLLSFSPPHLLNEEIRYSLVLMTWTRCKPLSTPCNKRALLPCSVPRSIIQRSQY